MSASRSPSGSSAKKRGGPTKTATAVRLQFDDNALLPMLYGEHDQHLARLEQQLGVHVAARGNRLEISGPPEASRTAEAVLNALYTRLRKKLEVGEAEVDAAVRLAQAPADSSSGDGRKDGPKDNSDGAGLADLHAEDIAIRTRKRHISPRSLNQAVYLRALQSHELVFAVGPAGTGKTYLAVAKAVSLMMAGKVDRIVLSRPAVEAGERLGFLPGDLREKVDPYLRPLYDALYEMLPAEQVMSQLASGEIEVAPLAFMRGRTLSNAFVILDEAQNSTPMQMKMFLTRLGENSRMAVTGDLSQVDLPTGQPSGLRDAVDLLGGMDNVALVRFTNVDVMRHSLVTRIVRAYEAREGGGGNGQVSE
jgi:phosphate starvation-inducible protein PhoH and related proteins